MKIRWIGQGGYLIGDGKTEICIDPYLSDAVEKASGKKRLVKAPFSPDELRSDAVICTHDHIDHVDPDAIVKMTKLRFFAPSDCEKRIKKCGVTDYIPFDDGDKISVGDFEIEAVYADHTTEMAIGVLIRHSGVTVYITGDTYYNERLIRDGVDIFIVCINGKLGNMSVDEAIRLTNEINPKIAIPSHYGMFAENTEDPKRFTSALVNGVELEYNTEYDTEVLLCSI